MTKFHINKHGVPAPCRAKAGNCPLGGSEQHFDNLKDAQAYADSQSEERHELLPGVKGDKNKVNKEITGDSYDNSLLKGDEKIEEVDLRMGDVGNGLEEGFLNPEDESPESIAYDNNLAEAKVDIDEYIDLSMEKVGSADEVGFISRSEANLRDLSKGYDPELVKPTEVEDVDLTMEVIGDGAQEGFI